MSLGIAVERYTPDLQAIWDSIVRSARANHFMFERSYMDYHQARFVDCSWIVSGNNGPIAVLPASINGNELVSHGGLTFGGFLSNSEFTQARAIDALDALLDSLRPLGVQRLVYKPLPHHYHQSPAEEDLFALYARGAVLLTREVTTTIPPGGSPNRSDERRRSLRKFEKSSACITESTDIASFMELLRSVLVARHGTLPAHSTEEMELLASRFPGQIRLFTVARGSQMLAGTLIYETATVAHSQYIAASTEGREACSLDGLFDFLISEVYRDLWFDFGISNERNGDLNLGLLRNKEGYGGRAILHDRYALQVP